jgi:glycosyltransferase involved in cell wall biosynthesis
MKIALLAAASSIHTLRWANSLSNAGHEVHLLSQHESKHRLSDAVVFHKLPVHGGLGYFLNVLSVRQQLKVIKPDILNAHYATGYGTTARLTGFEPCLLSVWGSDVYDFPERSLAHRWLLRANLAFATAIASTSNCMALKAAETYAHPVIFVTSFGVDVVRFQPRKKPVELSAKIVIGTVKTLAHNYGVDKSIHAFAYAWERLGRPTHLAMEISGGGPDREQLEGLAAKLGVAPQVTFMGAVPYDKVPAMLNRLDIFIALSRFESFGVAILEAAACEKPVIVSNAEGLAEVTRHGVNGFVVPGSDVSLAGEAMLKLIRNKELRLQMGKAGRRHVIENYSWDKSMDGMLGAYARTIQIAKKRA